MHYPELLIPAIISLVAVLFVLPWHIQLKNVATLSMTFWMTSLNVCHIINAALWSSSVDDLAPVWCDISAALQVGYNYALPLSHLLLARQLENLTSLRSRSVLFDEKLKRRANIINWLLAVVAPVTVILLHMTTQDRRYYILEGPGCVAATYWNVWGLILVAVGPILVAMIAFVYTVMALVNIQLRRQKMLSMVSSDSKTSRTQFIRLFTLAIAEFGTCLLRAIFNSTSFSNGPQPFGQLGDPRPINLTQVSALTKSEITQTIWTSQLLQWYTVSACSIVFFLCFVTGSETLVFYQNLASKMFPWCVSKRGKAFGTLTGGKTSGLSSSFSQTTKRSENMNSLDKTVHPDRWDGDNQLESGVVDPQHDLEEYKLNYVQSPVSPSSDYLIADASPMSPNVSTPVSVNLGKSAPITPTPKRSSYRVPAPAVRIQSPSVTSDPFVNQSEENDRVDATDTTGTVDSLDTVYRWNQAAVQLEGRFLGRAR